MRSQRNSLKENVLYRGKNSIAGSQEDQCLYIKCLKTEISSTCHLPDKQVKEHTKCMTLFKEHNFSGRLKMYFTNCLKPPSKFGTGYLYPAITIFVRNIHKAVSEQTVGGLKKETS